MEDLEEVHNNGFYHHFKGGKYKVIAIASSSSDVNNKVVVYQQLLEKNGYPAGFVWCRDFSEFVGMVKDPQNEKQQIKRFVYEEPRSNFMGRE